MRNPTLACQTLRKILHAKIDEGTLELPSKKQAIDDDPLPKRHGKGVCAVITGVGDDAMDQDNGSWALSEYQGPIDQASWQQYFRTYGYDNPWFFRDEWGSSSTLEGRMRTNDG